MYLPPCPAGGPHGVFWARVVGISKLVCLVDVYSKRLQVQEKMTAEIAACLDSVLKPFGVGVVVEAAHECMTTRGVHKSDVTMVTSCMLGTFRTKAATARSSCPPST